MAKEPVQAQEAALMDVQRRFHVVKPSWRRRDGIILPDRRGVGHDGGGLYRLRGVCLGVPLRGGFCCIYLWGCGRVVALQELHEPANDISGGERF